MLMADALQSDVPSRTRAAAAPIVRGRRGRPACGGLGGQRPLQLLEGVQCGLLTLRLQPRLCSRSSCVQLTAVWQFPKLKFVKVKRRLRDSHALSDETCEN